MSIQLLFLIAEAFYFLIFISSCFFVLYSFYRFVTLKSNSLRTVCINFSIAPILSFSISMLIFISTSKYTSFLPYSSTNFVLATIFSQLMLRFYSANTSFGTIKRNLIFIVCTTIYILCIFYFGYFFKNPLVAYIPETNNIEKIVFLSEMFNLQVNNANIFYFLILLLNTFAVFLIDWNFIYKKKQLLINLLNIPAVLIFAIYLFFDTSDWPIIFSVISINATYFLLVIKSFLDFINLEDIIIDTNIRDYKKSVDKMIKKEELSFINIANLELIADYIKYDKKAIKFIIPKKFNKKNEKVYSILLNRINNSTNTNSKDEDI